LRHYTLEELGNSGGGDGDTKSSTRVRRSPRVTYDSLFRWSCPKLLNFDSELLHPPTPEPKNLISRASESYTLTRNPQTPNPQGSSI